MTKTGSRRLLACVLALGLGGCAASPYHVTPSAKAFLPQHGKEQAMGEQRVAPGGVLMETPVGFRRAARLEQPVAVELVGKKFALASGDVLTGGTITGPAAGRIGPQAVVLCGDARANLAKSLMSLSTLGVTSLLNRTGTFNTLCLIDDDQDGRVEKAILVGVKSEKDAEPVAIAPAAYQLVANQPMPGESVARIVYAGKPGKTKGGLNFDLSVTEAGQPLHFDNVHTRVALDELPKRVQLMGAAFTVKSYDPADGSVTIDVERGFQEGEYGITTTTTTRYIPIYVPR